MAENLKWNASDYGGLSSLVAPSKDIWVPDLYYDNRYELRTVISS